LGIIDNIAVHIGDVVVSTNMEVIDTQAYHLVLGTDWLRKANAVINYKESQVTISDNVRKTQVNCRNSTAPLPQENDSEEESDEDEYEYEEEEEEEKETNLVLVMNERESPDQHFYKFSPWGIEIDHETFT
jgi:hypothetical protein